VPVWEEQKWVTHEQPLSRQTFRHLARLNERAAESAQRKQSRPNPIGNRKKRRKMEATTNINLSNLTDVVEDEPVDSSVEVV
jgi:hypothetical protein